MKKLELTIPEFALVVGTRAMIGAGIGMLVADRVNEDKRKAIGWTLFAIGAISTIPLMFEVLGKKHGTPEEAYHDLKAAA